MTSRGAPSGRTTMDSCCGQRGCRSSPLVISGAGAQTHLYSGFLPAPDQPARVYPGVSTGAAERRTQPERFCPPVAGHGQSRSLAAVLMPLRRTHSNSCQIGSRSGRHEGVEDGSGWRRSNATRTAGTAAGYRGDAGSLRRRSRAPSQPGRHLPTSHLLQIDRRPSGFPPVAAVIAIRSPGGGANLFNLRLLCFAHHSLRHGHGSAVPPEAPHVAHVLRATGAPCSTRLADGLQAGGRAGHPSYRRAPNVHLRCRIIRPWLWSTVYEPPASGDRHPRQRSALQHR